LAEVTMREYQPVMKSSTENDRVNHTEEDLMWIPGQRPEEFQKYFGACRIPRDQEGARKPSVSEEIIQTVVKYTAVPDYFPLAFNARPSYRVC
jgi:hypothetical protein